MIRKGDLKMLGITVAGIFVAGYLMNMGRDNAIVGDAIAGYDY
ncbi:hypothetical protein [Pseudovibrio ascidiaceicola]|jgi:hypothetical protein|nr:hypothetical protein [Pseudovibrio ascidiaceicola]